MREIWTIFMDYCGSGLYPFLFLAALVYLLVSEKDRRVRIVLAETSLVITLLFFCPLFKWGMDQVEEVGTYYRILWILPMTVVIAYAGVKLAGRHLRLGLAGLALVCVLGGDYVYDNVNISKAQNRYHLPDEVIAICNLMLPEDGQERVWAVFPAELIHFVRQYSSQIQMPYGREMLVPDWPYAKHPLYLQMEAPEISLETLVPLAEEYGIHYLVFNRSRPLKGDPQDWGLLKAGEIGGYTIYRDPAVEIWEKAKEQGQAG